MTDPHDPDPHGLWLCILGPYCAATVVDQFSLDPTDRVGLDEWLGHCEAEAITQGLQVSDEALKEWHNKALGWLAGG